MKEISNHFCIISPEMLSDFLTPDECTEKPEGAVEFICSRKIVIDQNPSSDSESYSWEISMSAASRDEGLKAYDGARAYVGVFFTDGSLRVLGNAWHVPRLSVTPYGGAYSVSLNYKSLKPIDL